MTPEDKGHRNSTFMTLRDELGIPMALVCRAACDYVLSRQSPTGGFCVYRGYHLEEPNLADTWHGLGCWVQLTRRPLPDPDRHAAFVVATDIEPQVFPLYYRICSLRALDANDPLANEVRDAVAALPLTLPDLTLPVLQMTLRQSARRLWLKRQFGFDTRQDSRMLAEFLIAGQTAEGGFGRPANLPDTSEALSLLKLCGKDTFEGVEGFLRAVEIPMAGFQLTRQSSSPSLETTCAGLMSCNVLGIAPRYATDALRFILHCQSPRGAFALRPSALPNIELTFLALATLRECLGVQVLEDLTNPVTMVSTPDQQAP